jgi:hypothetical protein
MRTAGAESGSSAATHEAFFRHAVGPKRSLGFGNNLQMIIIGRGIT